MRSSNSRPSRSAGLGNAVLAGGRMIAHRVAQSGTLLYRRMAFGRSVDRPEHPPIVLQPADCQLAIRQIDTLRCTQASPRHYGAGMNSLE